MWVRFHRSLDAMSITKRDASIRSKRKGLGPKPIAEDEVHGQTSHLIDLNSNSSPA